MPGKKPIPMPELLKHPKVLKVTEDVNAELLERRQYSPPVCSALSQNFSRLQPTDEFKFSVDKEAAKQLPDIINNPVQKIEGLQTADAKLSKTYLQKRNIGIVFSGGPAPGGHNVIAGLYDAVKKANPQSKVYGFLIGPDGIIENETLELNDDLVDAYRNSGGFTMIKTGRTKIDTPDKMERCRETCKKLDIDALVIVGGD
ncbi:MAG: 6-phosphofructokinase, partial [Deltaproteobacteria bacterium]|nr:6-phosphofructokinase [Deltaproteobacteria bacterium]